MIRLFIVLFIEMYCYIVPEICMSCEEYPESIFRFSHLLIRVYIKKWFLRLLLILFVLIFYFLVFIKKCITGPLYTLCCSDCCDEFDYPGSIVYLSCFIPLSIFLPLLKCLESWQLLFSLFFLLNHSWFRQCISHTI